MTDRDTQSNRVLERLVEAFPEGVSAIELLRMEGVYRAGARIYDLRKRGWEIGTEVKHGKTAVYRLLSLTNSYWKAEQEDLGL